MKIFYFLYILFSLNFAFSAKIGFINSDGVDCVSPKALKLAFQNYGHIIEATSYKYAYKYDLIISQNKLTNDSEIAKKTILISMEPKIILKELYDKKITDKYARVFTFNHNLCKNKKYLKMFYPCLKSSSKDPSILLDNFIPFPNRKLACMLNSIQTVISPEENYSKRLEVAKFYNQNFPDDLTLYRSGGWDKYHLSIYRGFCNWDDRPKLFKGHKFCYCYENWENNLHYISEKIQICFEGLCVPIYKGCSRITDYIPKETFINANDFNSTAEIHDFIGKMDEQTWMGYIHAIEKFIYSEDSNVFTDESHAQQLLESANAVLKELK